jgi:hypothetical protein
VEVLPLEIEVPQSEVLPGRGPPLLMATSDVVVSWLVACGGGIGAGPSCEIMLLLFDGAGVE